jgi:hypothetical protein
VNRLAGVLIALPHICLSPAAAGAQDTAFSSLAIMYGLTRNRPDADSTTPAITYHPTILVSPTARPPGRFSAVFEFGWAEGAAHLSAPRGGLDGPERRFTFLGGARFSGRGKTTQADLGFGELFRTGSGPRKLYRLTAGLVIALGAN